MRNAIFEIPIRNLYSSNRSLITDKTAEGILMLLNNAETAKAFAKIVTGFALHLKSLVSFKN